MKTSLLNYIDASGGFIDRNAPIVKESNESNIVKEPMVVEDYVNTQHQTSVAPEPVKEDIEIAPEVPEVLVSAAADHSVEHSVSDSLRESINNLQTVLVEQNNNQKHLINLVNELFESVKLHNNSINHRVESLDLLVQETSKILFETTEKLSAISTREINLPAPVVNVSLPEQKKIIKTVDRDSNGLIRQITEETE